MNKKDTTPLFLALKETHSDVAELLIKHKANIHLVDGCRRTALMLAVLCNSESLVDLLLEQNINVFAEDLFGRTIDNFLLPDSESIQQKILEYKAKIKPITPAQARATLVKERRSVCQKEEMAENHFSTFTLVQPFIPGPRMAFVNHCDTEEGARESEVGDNTNTIGIVESATQKQIDLTCTLAICTIDKISVLLSGHDKRKEPSLYLESISETLSEKDLSHSSQDANQEEKNRVNAQVEVHVKTQPQYQLTVRDADIKPPTPKKGVQRIKVKPAATVYNFVTSEEEEEEPEGVENDQPQEGARESEVEDNTNTIGIVESATQKETNEVSVLLSRQDRPKEPSLYLENISESLSEKDLSYSSQDANQEEKNRVNAQVEVHVKTQPQYQLTVRDVDIKPPIPKKGVQRIKVKPAATVYNFVTSEEEEEEPKGDENDKPQSHSSGTGNSNGTKTVPEQVNGDSNIEPQFQFTVSTCDTEAVTPDKGVETIKVQEATTVLKSVSISKEEQEELKGSENNHPQKAEPGVTIFIMIFIFITIMCREENVQNLSENLTKEDLGCSSGSGNSNETKTVPKQVKGSFKKHPLKAIQSTINMTVSSLKKAVGRKNVKISRSAKQDFMVISEEKEEKQDGSKNNHPQSISQNRKKKDLGYSSEPSNQKGKNTVNEQVEGIQAPGKGLTVHSDFQGKYLIDFMTSRMAPELTGGNSREEEDREEVH
ncbi:ankyrin repeat domain-containing protein 36B-like [Nycticebus coucang]|uniref:ankyrin repeat domain-containing protein 36B-like n=1 Tax=Nycticebus coucang TaxID=9470 RepID=UPI00234E23A2|nr:ankyrin repeat domain-containing protein 36B-like [Nycticebus coucang]